MKFYIFIIYLMFGTIALYGRAFQSPGVDKSDNYSIKTILAPDVPQLIAPKDNAESVIVMPRFEWESGSATFFRIQIAAYNGQGTEVIIDFETSNNYFIPEEALDYETLHFWQIKAFSGEEESEWSETWSFTTQIEPPAAPKLVYPANQSENVELNPNIVWNSVDRAETYTLQIAEGGNFPTPIVELNIKDTSYNEGVFEEGVSYSWRVKSLIGDIEGGWSIPFRFTTMTTSSVIDDVEDNFCLYPCPANEYLFVSIGVDSDYEIEIFSVSGSKVKQFNVKNYVTKLNISDLTIGIYIIRVKSEKYIFNKIFTKL